MIQVAGRFLGTLKPRNVTVRGRRCNAEQLEGCATEASSILACCDEQSTSASASG
jgi:hypothetical protein